MWWPSKKSVDFFLIFFNFTQKKSRRKGRRRRENIVFTSKGLVHENSFEVEGSFGFDLRYYKQNLKHKKILREEKFQKHFPLPKTFLHSHVIYFFLTALQQLTQAQTVSQVVIIFYIVKVFITLLL